MRLVSAMDLGNNVVEVVLSAKTREELTGSSAYSKAVEEAKKVNMNVGSVNSLGLHPYPVDGKGKLIDNPVNMTPDNIAGWYVKIRVAGRL